MSASSPIRPSSSGSTSDAVPPAQSTTTLSAASLTAVMSALCTSSAA